MKKRVISLFLIALIASPVLRASEPARHGYCVQVASMPDEESARAEVQRLLTNHHKAYYLKAHIAGKGLYYRVRVGQFPTQAEAVAYAQAMRRCNLVSAFLVTSFDEPSGAGLADSASINSRLGSHANQPGAPNLAASPVRAVADRNGAAKTNSLARSNAPAIEPSNNASTARNIATTVSVVSQRSEPRIKLVIGAATTVSFDETITSVTILDQEVATAEVKEGRTLLITSLMQGETVMIASGGGQRRTFVIEVAARPSKTAQQIAAATARRAQAGRLSGTLVLSFTPALNDAPALLRQKFEYSQKLNGNRTLRFDGDMFNFFGQGDRATVSLANGFGMDRVTFGLDTPSSAWDFLDSQLIISPLSFYGYTMRGLHLVSKPDSRFKAYEIFAGVARPSTALFGGRAGFIAGAVRPIAEGASWRARAGVLAIVPEGRVPGERSGIIFQTDARYAPSEKIIAEGELAFADNALSARGRIDLRRGAFNFLGESLRLDRTSALIGIGAQSGGRHMNAFVAQWLPGRRLVASINYNRTTAIPVATAQRAALDSSSLFASANFSISDGSQIGLRFAEQKIAVAASPQSSPLQLDTQTAAVTYYARFNRRLSNSLEARLASSREPRVDAGVEHGLSLREELNLALSRWQMTGYLDHALNTPSLVGIIIRNPSLLPPLVRRAYEADPVEFLLANRGLLASLLAGVELPETRSTNLGLRLQGRFSRYALTSDIHYSSGEILALEQQNIFASFSVDMRLDPANSLRVMGARAFSLSRPNGFFTLSFSYTHRFGGGSEGFHFGHLLGLDRGALQGRVFADLNGNGQDDAGEQGVAGVKVRLDEKTTVMTDEGGRFRFSTVRPGDYTVSLLSSDLGVRFRASTASEQPVSLAGRQKVNVSFGITNFGFIAGRVFNDLLLTGDQRAITPPGIAGVRLNLRMTEAASGHQAMSQTVDASGQYEFRNLTPGNYTLALDPETLPPDYGLPSQTEWKMNVEPLRGFYLDISIAAQRAVSGVVFIDKDGDGQFDPQKDEPVASARVRAGEREAITGPGGAYILRNLPAGRVELQASAVKCEEKRAVIELAAEPALMRGINFSMARIQTKSQPR